MYWYDIKSMSTWDAATLAGVPIDSTSPPLTLASYTHLSNSLFLHGMKFFVLIQVYDNVMWLLEELQQILNDAWNAKSLLSAQKACTVLDDLLPIILTRSSFIHFPPQSAIHLTPPGEHSLFYSVPFPILTPSKKLINITYSPPPQILNSPVFAITIHVPTFFSSCSLALCLRLSLVTLLCSFR